MSASFDFSALDGRWYVVHSTLKLWRTGGRANPSITYTERSMKPDGTAYMRDEVNFHQPGSFGGGLKAKSIVGWDRQNAKDSKHFVWRGTGMLGWVTCPCEVLWIEPHGTDNEVMVMFFSKTLFTEAGIDVLARKKENLPEEILKAIDQRMEKDFPQYHKFLKAPGLHATRKVDVPAAPKK